MDIQDVMDLGFGATAPSQDQPEPFEMATSPTAEIALPLPD